MNLLAAAGAAGSPVRKVVVKSSTLVYGANYKDPYSFREEMTPHERAAHRGGAVAARGRELPARLRRGQPARHREQAAVLERARRRHRHRLLEGPAHGRVPEILGFDPRFQFTHEDDVDGALLFATTNDVPGVYNVGGDGTIPWSEVCAIVGKPRIPLPPLLTNWAVEPLRMTRVIDLPPEMLSLLRYGRGRRQPSVQAHRLPATSTRPSAPSTRSRAACGSSASSATSSPSYRYERDVETFFRHSPAIVVPARPDP